MYTKETRRKHQQPRQLDMSQCSETGPGFLATDIPYMFRPWRFFMSSSSSSHARKRFFQVAVVNIRGDTIHGDVGLIDECGHQLTMRVSSLTEVGLGPGHLDKCAALGRYSRDAHLHLYPLDARKRCHLVPPSRPVEAEMPLESKRRVAESETVRHHGSRVLISVNFSRPSTEAPGRQAPQRRTTCGALPKSA